MSRARLEARFGLLFACAPALAFGGDAIRVLHHRVPAWVAQDPSPLFAQGRPSCRGFRVTIPGENQQLDQFQPWPLEMPDAEHSTPMWKSAELVNRRLARDGLLWTL